MKQFSCSAVVSGCDATFTAENEDALMGQIADHARDDHGMDTIPDEVVEQVKAGITDAPA